MTRNSQIALFKPERHENAYGWFSDSLGVLGINEDAGWPDAFGDALRRLDINGGRKPIKTLSLFSGAGGLDIGFHDAGFQIVECNEIEKAFAATLNENSTSGGRLESTNVVCMDVNDYDPYIKDLDFIIGGPPCQTFSAAGARAAGVDGTDDERGNLFLQYARLINKLKPKGFLFENVYRIIGAQQGKPWLQIQEAFQSLGYTLHWRILDAADYGVPQFRERLFIVGLRSGEYEFPFPSHGPDSPDQRKYYTAKQAVNGVEVHTTPSALGGRHGHLLEGIPPGLNYSFYTEKLGHPTPFFGWRSKFSDYLYKADPETPVRTVKAQGGQYTGPFSWKNRGFTVDELKRLQTFPDDYVIVGNRQKAIHQIGNSVPPQLARILALSIAKQVFETRLPFALTLMPTKLQLGFRQRKRALTQVYAKKAASAIAKLPKIPRKTSCEKTGLSFINISHDLRIEILENSDDAHFRIEHTNVDGNWLIQLQECDKTSPNLQYEIEVLPLATNDTIAGISSLKMTSSSADYISVTALWKYWESLVKSEYSKDDLVQLFGYYQYKQKYSIKFTIHDQKLGHIDFWNLLSQVSIGIGVGEIIALSSLAEIFDVPPKKLFVGLRNLKKIGYEIRSNNTNKQVKEDMFLIPYSFPSLNERSLQRLTEL